MREGRKRPGAGWRAAWTVSGGEGAGGGRETWCGSGLRREAVGRERMRTVARTARGL